MPAYLIELEVDGAGFHGTQIQAFGRTVQGVVGEALADLDADSTFRPGSRLDQGVSARALVGLCKTGRDWDAVTLALALNQRLPADLIIVRSARVTDDFDPLRAACIKTYGYTILVRPVRPVLVRRCWWIRDLGAAEILAVLAAQLPGRRDLSGFACLRHDNTDDQDPVREYLTANWNQSETDDGCYRHFTISGRGFLYKQIRGLVGAMVAVAQGRATADGFTRAVAAGRSAERLGNIAPAEGLVLDSVRYDGEIPWKTVAVGNRGGDPAC